MLAGLLLFTVTAQAQTKKAPAKATPKKTTAAPGAASINATNYGKVIDYLNGTIDCMNAQQTAIADREHILSQMYDIYVTRDSKDKLGNKITHFSPFRLRYDYAGERAGEKCVAATPPAIMGATDVAFYTANYKAVNDAYITVAKKWNEIASAVDKNSISNYTLDEGKIKCEELIAALEQYSSARSTVSKRTRVLQNDLFAYSVAKSPLKKQYVNMRGDLTAIQEFAATLGGYEDMKKNKASIATALDEIENASIKHNAEMPPESSGFGFNYNAYYSDINRFVSQVKTILNGTIRDRDVRKEMEEMEHRYKSIIQQYNSVMSN